MVAKFIKISKSELFEESRQETGSLEISIEDLEEFEVRQPHCENTKFRKIIQKLKKFEERFQMFQVLY